LLNQFKARDKVMTDPVCGMQIRPGKEAGSYSFKGMTYLFCSKHCLHTFQAVPGRHVGKQESPRGHAAHTHQAHGAVQRVAAPALTTACADERLADVWKYQ